MYPEPRQRDLSETEKEQIRERIKKGDDDIYKLAKEFGRSSSQISGVKVALHR
jgi:transposase-like protein